MDGNGANGIADGIVEDVIREVDAEASFASRTPIEFQECEEVKEEADEADDDDCDLLSRSRDLICGLNTLESLTYIATVGLLTSSCSWIQLALVMHSRSSVAKT